MFFVHRQNLTLLSPTVSLLGSMVIRLRPCMTSTPASPHPSLPLSVPSQPHKQTEWVTLSGVAKGLQ